MFSFYFKFNVNYFILYKIYLLIVHKENRLIEENYDTLFNNMPLFIKYCVVLNVVNCK